MYSAEAFAVAQLVSVIPYSVLCTVLSWLLLVHPVGFCQGPAGPSKLLVILFVELFGVIFAQLIGAISPSIQIVALLDPLLATDLTALCGYPGIWEWAEYYLASFTRVMGGMICTELHGLKIQIQCKLHSIEGLGERVRVCH